MLNKNNIKELSELYGIPKSTLRYWHTEGLIHFDRDRSNDYRIVSLKTLIETGDIAFYRSLNMPIDELKHLQERNVDELENIIENSSKKIEDQILLLKESLKKIEIRKRRIQQYRQFMEQPYSLSKPNFKKLIKNNFQQEYHRNYISDPYSAVLLFPFKDKTKFESAFVASDEVFEQNILWNVDNTSNKFLHCLIKTDYGAPNASCLEEHMDYFHRNSSQMGDVVCRYLFTSYDQKLYDYNEGWIEIIEG